MKKVKSFAFFFFLLLGLVTNAQNIVNFKDPKIFYIGRTPIRDTSAELSWTGAAIVINFNGTAVKAILNDEKGLNYYNVIVDDKVVQVLKLKQGKNDYVLATGLPAGKHKVELFKRTEYDWGRTWFYGFNIDGKLFSPPTYKHRIEYYGDSITCGMADEDTSGKDRGDNDFENGYASYANVAARYFNADMHCISKSGIGVVISWFDYVMPDIYDKVYAHSDEKWDFSKYTPEIVVVNLFQNDSWLTKAKDNEQFKKQFGSTPPTAAFMISHYQTFIKNIRSKYPKAKIVCALGSMDATKKGSPWPGYIEKAVAGLNDKGVYTHFFAFKNTPGHPSVAEQKAMGDDLIAYIKTTFNW